MQVPYASYFSIRDTDTRHRDFNGANADGRVSDSTGTAELWRVTECLRRISRLRLINIAHLIHNSDLPLKGTVSNPSRFRVGPWLAARARLLLRRLGSSLRDP
jgi:hypothetical protein